MMLRLLFHMTGTGILLSSNTLARGINYTGEAATDASANGESHMKAEKSICCSSSNVNIPTTYPEVLQTEFESDFPSLHRPPVIPSSCVRRYIISNPQDKDSITRPNAYPWMAVLVDRENQPFCGGTLIDNYHILTAAHCLDQIVFPSDIYSKVRVYLGAHDLQMKNPKQLQVNISKVIRHRDYNHQTLVNDIAMLRLETPLTSSKYLYPVCLHPKEPQSSWSQAVVAGWGKHNTTCESCPSSILRHTRVNLISKSDCEKKYEAYTGPVPHYSIRDNMICAFTPGSDACDGDSGGPLFLTEDPDAGIVQVGIVSWGVDCGLWPGVYTRLSSYLPWIMENREIF